METVEININNLPEGWSIEEGRKKSRTTGKKRIFIIDDAGACVGASCGKCGAVLEVGGFSKAKNKKTGIMAMCKACERLRNSMYYQENKEVVQGRQKQYRQDNKETNKKRWDKYYQENKQKIDLKNKVYGQTHKEEAQKRWAKYYQQNKEHILNKNKKWFKDNEEYYKRYRMAYVKDNLHLYRIQGHKRRALKKNNGGSFTDAQLKECLEFFNGCCAYTGEQLGSYDLDHIQPISKGGTSFIYNLVPATATANRSKSNKDLISWYMQQEYYSQDRLNKILEWQEIAFNKYYKEDATA